MFSIEDIDRAYELAKLEKELGVSSTYTVQLRNNTYNALSEKNIDLVRKIKDLGHHIGLHQNPPIMDLDKLKCVDSKNEFLVSLIPMIAISVESRSGNPKFSV